MDERDTIAFADALRPDVTWTAPRPSRSGCALFTAIGALVAGAASYCEFQPR